MLRYVFIVFLFFVIGIAPSHAGDHIYTHVPDAKIVGKARMSVFLWDVYDAVLYAPRGTWSKDKPFALKLNYLRRLNGKKIADRSAEEIRGQGFSNELKLATWHAQMRKIFPDVENGEAITGVFTDNGEALFYKDNNEIGRIADPEFSRAFFGIWLDEKTSEPALRRELLGKTNE